jgi:hypothetical protein
MNVSIVMPTTGALGTEYIPHRQLGVFLDYATREFGKNGNLKAQDACKYHITYLSRSVWYEPSVFLDFQGFTILGPRNSPHQTNEDIYDPYQKKISHVY